MVLYLYQKNNKHAFLCSKTSRWLLWKKKCVWLFSNLKREAWKRDNSSCVFRALLSNLLLCLIIFSRHLIQCILLSHFQRWHLGSCYCVADNRSVCLCILWPNTQLAGGCSLCASSPCQWNFPQLRKLCSLIPKFVKKC